MYANGDGVAKDMVLSYMWRNLAAAQGNEIAKTVRDALEQSMTSQQVERAQQMSRDWKPTK